MKNSPRKAKLAALADAMDAADVAYAQRGQESSLFQMPVIDTGTLVRDDFLFLFKSMRRMETPARAIYDEIRGNNWRGLCPLCSQIAPESLDHYLEKAIHFGLAITPLNLVAACSRCNHARSRLTIAQQAEQTLHPYFDHCDDDTWLVCDVLETEPISLRFRAAPPAHWAQLKRARVENHFRVLDLATLYAVHGASELVGRRAVFAQLGSADSADELRALLTSEAESRRQSERNSWQGALYTALANSQWFCGGGYAAIPAPVA